MILQAGMQAVRENRYVILTKDFEKAYKKAIRKEDTEHDFYKWSIVIIHRSKTIRDLVLILSIIILVIILRDE